MPSRKTVKLASVLLIILKTVASAQTAHTNPIFHTLGPCLSKFGDKSGAAQGICASDGAVYPNLQVALCMSEDNEEMFKCSGSCSFERCRAFVGANK